MVFVIQTARYLIKQAIPLHPKRKKESRQLILILGRQRLHFLL
jgi:hypothetical protein